MTRLEAKLILVVIWAGITGLWALEVITPMVCFTLMVLIIVLSILVNLEGVE